MFKDAETRQQSETTNFLDFEISDKLFLDPLGRDEFSDPVMKLSQRQLLRLLMVAAETGGRCQREGANIDPVAWLLSPRDLFHGQAAIDACRDRRSFVRAIILHGLSLGFDADPVEIDRLLLDERVDVAVHNAAPCKGKAAARGAAELHSA